MPDDPPHRRSERLIVSGRLVLAVASLLALWLDPFQPSRHAGFVYAGLTVYVAYALAVAAAVWRWRLSSGRVAIVTHGIDITVFVILMYFDTEGSLSPFLILLMFSLLSAGLRWRWWGTLWTAAGVFVLFVGMAVYAAYVLRAGVFELEAFFLRSGFLAAVAFVLGGVGVHDQRRVRELSLLACWAGPVPRERARLAREILQPAAEWLGAPRVVLVWEEREEPWLHVASWSGQEARHRREPPGTWVPLVAARLYGETFACRRAASPAPKVRYVGPDGRGAWLGSPLHPDFREEFAVSAVLSAPVVGEKVEGRIFWLDRPRVGLNEMRLAATLAHRVALRMDLFHFPRRLPGERLAEERLRLARDLHDGLLQSLAAAGLQLQAVHGLLAAEPDAARARLQELQRVIAADQRELRAFIESLRPASAARRDTELTLTPRLDDLVRRVEGAWAMNVTVTLAPEAERLSGMLARESWLMVQEALVNAARHGKASNAALEIETDQDQLRIVVADNGHGFPFRGRYDHVALEELRRGPISLKERIASLGGSLAIDSSEAGARLEITVPLGQPGG
jgi:signal transduction histidine kinase